jgi:hypothetical protein
MIRLQRRCLAQALFERTRGFSALGEYSHGGAGVDLRLLPSREVSPAERLTKFYISLIVEI